MVRLIPVYWINLDRSKDRRRATQRELKKFKVRSVRVSAVDAARDLSKYKITKSWKCSWTTDKEYACTLSHLEAITRAYVNGDQVATILEDDMIILRLPTNKLIDAAPEDWDIIQLCVWGRKARIYKNPKTYFTPWRQSWSHAGGYTINRRGMIKVLYALSPDVLSNNDLSEVSFAKTLVKFPTFWYGACNSDYVIYRMARTYTCCDISMYEDSSMESTVQLKTKKNIASDLIKFLYFKRGFIMPW